MIPSIDDVVRGRVLADLDTKIRQQRGRDRQAIIMEVFKIASDEEKIREKMSRTPRFSDKWWHLLGMANTLRNDLISGFEITDGIDEGISRGLLFRRGS